MLAVLLSAVFLAQFDFFVVNVAAPSLGRELHAGPAALELVVGGYAFAYAAGMITGGRLGDRYGHRRVFVCGVAGFTLASLLCGLALTPAQLVAARLLQGLAGAVMVPQVLAVLTAALPSGGQRRALGWYGAASGLGSIAGQVLGGLLLDADLWGLGWRVAFLLTVPVGALAVPAALRLLPRLPPAERPARLDVRGALGIAGSLGLLLAPLTFGREQGWPAWTWACMAASLPAAALTLVRQRALLRRGGSPVLDLSLLRDRVYVCGLAAGGAFLAYFASFMFTLTLLLQDGRGLSPLAAGSVFAPMGVAFACSSLLGGRAVRRFGLRAVRGGALLIALGLLSLRWASDAPLPWLVAALVMIGTGNGLVLPRLLGISLLRIPPTSAGVGAAMLTTVQQFGGAAGVAAVGTTGAQAGLVLCVWALVGVVQRTAGRA